MDLFISSLNSGSNGNCYYVGNKSEGILIDAGISCRETEKRMKNLGIEMQGIKAIFISHEHSDHINGLRVLSEKYQLPVYVTPLTSKHIGQGINGKRIIDLFPDQPVIIGNLTITAFSKFHDAVDPLSFIVKHKEITVGIFTDIGIACDKVISYFSQCHAAFLEANYDEAMLENGRYPVYLKNRIRGGKGHLSNKQALELFCRHRPEFMSHLLLSHLSNENNSPKLVKNLFDENAGNVEIIVTSRHTNSALVGIRPSLIPIKQKVQPTYRAVQVRLFD